MRNSPVEVPPAKPVARSLRPPRLLGVMPMPWGNLALYAEGADLIDLDWQLGESPTVAREPDPLWDRCRTELAAYLAMPTHRFTLGFPTEGTPFQRRVWQALCAIPAGQVRTYGDLAQTLDSGPRAVAQACRSNPWPLIVPCHRVVASRGLGGYGGAVEGPRLRIKQRLLAHEGVGYAD